LLRGQKRGTGLPAGYRGKAPVGFGAKTQKLETHAEYSTEQNYKNSTQQKYFEKNSATTGDMHPLVFSVLEEVFT